MKNFLNPKDKVTIVKINSMAMTVKFEATIVMHNENEFLFKIGRKRKVHQIRDFKHVMILKGHNVVNVDTDGYGVMRGNASFNFVSDKSTEEFKEHIESLFLNVVPDDSKGRIILYSKEQASDSLFEPTINNLPYPDVYVSSAIIERIKNRK